MAFRGVLDRPESNSERFIKEFSNTARTIHGLGREEQADKLAGEKLGIEKAKLLSGKDSSKINEKLQSYEVGLGTLQDIKKIIPKLGSLNWFSSLKPGSEADVAEQQYKSYVNSLLGILTTIPVKNQAEFEAIRETFAHPHASQARIRGAVDAAENIIKRQIASQGGQLSSDLSGQQSPSNFGDGEMVVVLDPQGKPRRIPKNQVNAALEAGGRMPR